MSPQPTPAEPRESPFETVLRSKVTWRLMPVLFFLYVLAFLDRSNVSVAKLGMKKPLEEGGLLFNDDVISHGIGLFFWGYWILEIPSTLSVERWGARWVFCRILVLWGICATLVGFIGMPWMNSAFSVLPHLPEIAGDASTLSFPAAAAQQMVQWWNTLSTDPKSQFYFLRFTLGFFEGGFFPSVIFYLSYWFRPQDRAKAVAMFMFAIPASLAIGMPLSGELAKIQWLDLPGWRWVFILEGIAPIIAGIAVVFVLPNRPQDAKWLNAEERDFLTLKLDRENAGKRHHSFSELRHKLGWVVLLTLVYFTINVGGYGVQAFMPSILKERFGLSDIWASRLAGLPYVVAFFSMWFNGWHSDRSKERVLHVAAPLFGLGFFLSLAGYFYDYPYAVAVILILGVGSCVYSCLPPFWPVPTMFLGTTAAAAGIGFINMIGNLGGHYGPRIIGVTDKEKDRYAQGLMMAGLWPMAGAVVAVLLYLWLKRSHRPAAAAIELAGPAVHE